MVNFVSFLLALLLPLSAISQTCGSNMFKYRAVYSSGQVCEGVGATSVSAFHAAMAGGVCHGNATLSSYPGYVSVTAGGCSGTQCTAIMHHTFGGTASNIVNYQSGNLSTVNVPCPDACTNLNGNPVMAEEMDVPTSGALSVPTTVCVTASDTGGANGGPLKCQATYLTKPTGIWSKSPTGQWYFVVTSATEASKYKYTGGSCTDTNTDGKPDQPEPDKLGCATGQCPGVVNGTNVCVPCTGTATNDSTKTTTDKDSTGTTTGTETTDKSVTCDGNYCTIKTETTNTGSGGGGGGGSSTTEEKVDKKTFCEDNPTHPACLSRWQEEGCDKEPVCEGDPIACAQATLAKKTYCENFVKATELTDLGTAAANGENYPEGHPRADAETSSFNFAAAFGGASSGGGGCPADVSVMGVVVPLSSTCDGLNGLGIAALGIALIWAARVVFGS